MCPCAIRTADELRRRNERLRVRFGHPRDNGGPASQVAHRRVDQPTQPGSTHPIRVGTCLIPLDTYRAIRSSALIEGQIAQCLSQATLASAECAAFSVWRVGKPIKDDLGYTLRVLDGRPVCAVCPLVELDARAQHLPRVCHRHY